MLYNDADLTIIKSLNEKIDIKDSNAVNEVYKPYLIKCMVEKVRSYFQGGFSKESLVEKLQTMKDQMATKEEAIDSNIVLDFLDMPTEDEFAELYFMYLAYFQAFTNTYAPIPYLKRIFEEAIADTEVAGLSIATRPDCISAETITLLSALNAKKPVYVELGLQTIHEKSAEFIRRGYPLSCYDTAVAALSAARIPVITHVILGLPYETKQQMLETVRYVCASGIHGIKLQLLHILKDTDLADFYFLHKEDPNVFACMEQDAYFSVIRDCLPLLPEDMLVYRLTGDGPKHSLIDPLWSADKKRVLNALQRIRKE